MLVAPRTDPDGRSLAHPVLISDDQRQTDQRDLQLVWFAGARWQQFLKDGDFDSLVLRQGFK